MKENIEYSGAALKRNMIHDFGKMSVRIPSQDLEFPSIELQTELAIADSVRSVMLIRIIARNFRKKQNRGAGAFRGEDKISLISCIREADNLSAGMSAVRGLCISPSDPELRL